MNNALLAGVSGLKSHQTMIDVAGNNLANINTTAFKSSRVSFAEMLNQTLKEANQPTATLGGTNPMQVGSGVGIASVDRNMNQGSLIQSGNPLDMAVSGNGYFVLSDSGKDVYTRVGAFAVDSQFYLVDPATGNRVQRIGTQGVADGFQEPSSSDIRIPYDVALPAHATENFAFTGNLSADDNIATTTELTSIMQYTSGGAVCSESTLLKDLDQASGALAGTITVSGKTRAGANVNTTLNVNDTTTVGTLLTAMTMSFPGSTARLVNGELRLKDDASGYSLTDINLEYTGTNSLDFPKDFEMKSAGGSSAMDANIELFDSQGIGHVMSAAFVRTDVPNEWDMVVTSMTGDVELVDRRIRGITFLANGSIGGVSDSSSLQFIFGNDPTNTRTVSIDFGTSGEFNGLSQLGGDSTAAPGNQDGYASGWLSTLSVTRDGTLVGVFTNGIRKDIAALKIATFQNPAGMESIGGNYYVPSANSGDPVATQALTGGAGAINGGSLEKSNVEVASEFVNLIQAQNGFQANAKTISVSNEMLRDLTNLIR